MPKMLDDGVWYKSTRSGHVECVELTWHSGNRCDSAYCVQLAQDGDHYLMRNSKDPDGPMLRFTRGEIEAFIGGAKDGDFDHLIS